MSDRLRLKLVYRLAALASPRSDQRLWQWWHRQYHRRCTDRDYPHTLSRRCRLHRNPRRTRP
ncbi:MAG: hypothetical protein U0528_07785 [Anaerolineae bacterium]